ncbi:Protein NLRC3 [Gigaspora margarita]|uniref:Protein NLRC3 n=1 Tax=Gigaspora margarita TaxID=4874 RepID=A0A8H4A6D4_GIGMA|nr:Protein NLRC3 [Gigaspora margarita]
MLNAEEQSLLIPFKITLPSHPKPLFEYSSYITYIKNYLYNGIRNWLHDESYETGCKLENAVKSSLIAMFLRTSKNLKYLSLSEIICNQIIFENLYENTTITSIDLYNFSSDFKYKAIDVLVKILCRNSTLTSLDLSNGSWSSSNNIGSEGGRALADALCKNNTLKFLNLQYNNLGSEGGKALAKALCSNTTLASLDISYNNIGSEVGKALANAICKNFS